MRRPSPTRCRGSTRRWSSCGGSRRREEDAAAISPQSWVRDHIQAERNHFPYLEEAAETLAGALGDPLTVAEPLRRRLKEGFGIEARIVPPELLDGASQHYDLHRKRLMLSALLRPESRTFGLAYQLALVEFRPLLEKMVEAAAPPDAPTRHLLHMSLANYAAGAIMMPYAPFLAAAETHRYDIDRLCAVFGASVEQVAHRLTTLGRSGARGIPFFMLRVDAAGNISKRFAGESFPFSPLRRHLPALEPAHRLPDAGAGRHPDRRDARRPALLHHRPHRRALGPARSARGQPARHRPRLRRQACGARSSMPTASTSPTRYVTAIGPACAICPRIRCPQRAAPPVGQDADRQRDAQDDLALPVPRRLKQSGPGAGRAGAGLPLGGVEGDARAQARRPHIWIGWAMLK